MHNGMTSRSDTHGWERDWRECRSMNASSRELSWSDPAFLSLLSVKMTLVRRANGDESRSWIRLLHAHVSHDFMSVMG